MMSSSPINKSLPERDNVNFAAINQGVGHLPALVRQLCPTAVLLARICGPNPTRADLHPGSFSVI